MNFWTFFLLSCQLQPKSTVPDPDSGGPLLTDTGANERTRFVLADQEVSVVHSEYLTSTWNLNQRSEAPYPSLFENEKPTFYVLHPEIVPQSANVMWWFHGSAFGLDTEETPRGCKRETIVPAAKRVVNSENLPAALLSHQGWVVIAIRNDWCDMWRGQGNDDPVDPQHHFGGQHMAEVFAFVRAGGLGFVPSGEALWGTSMGGVAAMRAASLHGPFESLIMDSSPSSALLFYELEHGPNDRLALEHVFGGPPYDQNSATTEYFSEYQSGSAEVLLEAGEMDVPIFAHFNALDIVTPVNHAHALRDALLTHGSQGSGVHDHNHPAPGQDAHVQTLGGPNLDQGYTASAMLHFSLGSAVQWTEAESECPSCTAGNVINAVAQPDLKTLSGAAGRKLEPSETGIFWAQPLTADVHHVQPMLSRVSSSGEVRLLFHKEQELISETTLPVSAFVQSGLEEVRNGLERSYVRVPDQSNRFEIQLLSNSSAVLDGVLTYTDRP